MSFNPRMPTLSVPIQKPKNSVQLIKPFGPILAKTTMPQTLIDELNEFCDSTIARKSLNAELNAGPGLAGNVTQEIKLSKELLKNGAFLNFLSTSVQSWLGQATGKKTTKVNLLGSWIVRQFQHEYNPIHTHTGHISGVGYLKVPSDLGDYYQKGKSANNNGKIEFVHGSRNFLCSGSHLIKPQVGDFYLFPNYLFHTVYPFLSNEERRSVSFNAFIDDDLYNSAS